MTSPEDQATEKIGCMLHAASCKARNVGEANISASRGSALHNFLPKSGHGFADYLLYVHSSAAVAAETKEQGFVVAGIETQANTQQKSRCVNRNFSAALSRSARGYI